MIHDLALTYPRTAHALHFEIYISIVCTVRAFLFSSGDWLLVLDGELAVIAVLKLCVGQGLIILYLSLFRDSVYENLTALLKEFLNVGKVTIENN